jgi:uncharacterized Ntn-hydrolase superfamily protein
MRSTYSCGDLNSGDLAGRWANTYSIVARDPETEELGVAVQSHYFAAGAAVPWLEPHVGAVATQATVEFSYGPLGLDLMREGKSAPEALRQLVAADEGRDVRQVAMIDASGRVAAHTGARTIEAAGHIVGDNFSVQGNMLLNANVWPAMAQAYRQTRADLAERMLAALDAAEAAGGDVRGRQSAALVVTSAKPGARAWERTFDIRVDDGPEPLVELRRLAGLQRAILHSTAAGEAATRGDLAAAEREFAEVLRQAPDSEEHLYWGAVTMAAMGRVNESIPLFRRVFARNRGWAILLERLSQERTISRRPGADRKNPQGSRRKVGEIPHPPAADGRRPLPGNRHRRGGEAPEGRPTLVCRSLSLSRERASRAAARVRDLPNPTSCRARSACRSADGRRGCRAMTLEIQPYAACCRGPRRPPDPCRPRKTERP